MDREVDLMSRKIAQSLEGARLALVFLNCSKMCRRGSIAAEAPANFQTDTNV